MTIETLSKPEQSTQADWPACCCGPMRCGAGAGSTRDILDRRYASGELTKEQYEQIKRDLENAAQGTVR